MIPGLIVGSRILERQAADPAGRGQQVELGLVLDRAQLLDHGAERCQLDARCLLRQGLVTGHGQFLRLEQQPAVPAPRGEAAERGHQEPLGQQLEIGGITLRGEGVPGVGGEHAAALRGHQQRGVGAGQAGEVADVRQVGDQRCVGVERGDPRLGALTAGDVHWGHIVTVRRSAAWTGGVPPATGGQAAQRR